VKKFGHWDIEVFKTPAVEVGWPSQSKINRWAEGTMVADDRPLDLHGTYF
jgi:hypothetical protein